MGIVILTGFFTIFFFISWVVCCDLSCDDWVEGLLLVLAAGCFIVSLFTGIISFDNAIEEPEVQDQTQIDRAILVYELESIDSETPFEVAVEIYEKVEDFNSTLEKNNSHYDGAWLGRCYYDLTMVEPIDLEQYWDEYNKLEIEEGEKE